MPTYEYQCTACGHQLEAFQKMSEAPLKECPKCQQATLSKQVSAAGFQLKGTGWYKTDYAKPTANSTETKPSMSSDTSTKTDGSSSTSSGTGST